MYTTHYTKTIQETRQTTQCSKQHKPNPWEPQTNVLTCTCMPHLHSKTACKCVIWMPIGQRVCEKQALHMQQPLFRSSGFRAKRCNYNKHVGNARQAVMDVCAHRTTQPTMLSTTRRSLSNNVTSPTLQAPPNPTKLPTRHLIPCVKTAKQTHSLPL